MIKDEISYKPPKAYTIFTGIIRSKQNAIDLLNKDSAFENWQTHVFANNSENEFYNNNSLINSKNEINYLNGYYYKSFICCLFPDENDKYSHALPSYTFQINEIVELENFSVDIKYIDIFPFKNNILLYSFKVEHDSISLDQISYLNKQIRILNPKDNTVLKRVILSIENYVEGDFIEFGNKLKIFSVIQHDLDLSNNLSQDHLLFDLATCHPIGTSIGKGSNPNYQPSKEFFEKTMDNYKISIFENWIALSLFDSFTVLHKGEVYNFNWEFRYFRLLYIHSLYVKHFLADINRQFHSNNSIENLEEEFHNFNTHINLNQISHNFLPQLIYNKIRQGLNIDLELDEIRDSLNRDYRKQIERRTKDEAKNEKKINNALLIIAFLGIFTAVFDGSEWIANLFHIKYGIVYNILGLGSFLIILLAMILVIRRK